MSDRLIVIPPKSGEKSWINGGMRPAPTVVLVVPEEFVKAWRSGQELAPKEQAS